GGPQSQLDQLGLGLRFARLPELGVEPMSTDVGRAGEHLVHGAPAPTVARADAGGVQALVIDLTPIGPELPSPSRARRKISRTVSAWIGSISRVFLTRWPRCSAASTMRADRRQRAVPKTLAGALLHGPQRMLGVLPRLVLVEQRHDLTDHVAHRIIAELLGDRRQSNAVFGQPADVELQLELIAEETAEAVDQDHIERRRLGRGRVDQALELGPPVVRRGDAGLDVVGDDLPPSRGAVAFRLTALVRDG